MAKKGRISVAAAKAKGRNLQKWVCKKISEATGIPYDQQDDQCLIHSREMGQKGTDVILRGQAIEDFPFSVECKSCESFSITSAIEQAKANEVEYTDWLVVHKRKAWRKPVVIIDAERFFEIWGRLF